MNILCIGNSFSIDAARYLHQIAKAAGKDINVGNLYIGGCPISRHLQNINNPDIHDYEFHFNGKRIDDNWYNIFFGLRYMKWDYITFQQVSGLSVDSKTYFPELSELLKKVRKESDATFILHRTWAYAPTHSHEKYGSNPLDQKAMHEDIVKAYEEVSKITGIPYIIPSGSGIYDGCTKLHRIMHRDGFHINERGRTLCGIIWAYYFFGLDIDVSSYEPEGYSYDDVTPPVSKEEYKELIELAREVIKNNKKYNLIK